MRTLPLAATLTALVAALLSRQAAAAEQPAAIAEATPADAESAATPSAADAAPPSVRDGARPRELELEEALFAHEELSMTGRRVTRDGTSLRPAAFYALVGRPDLVEQSRTRRATKGFAIGIGAAAMTLGAVMGVADGVANVDNGLNRAVNLCGTSEVSDKCAQRQTSDAPLALMIGGGVAMVAGLVLPADPLGPGEKQALVDDYNRRLRARMGLSSALDAAKRTASVSAAVVPDGQSGMLLARCAF